MKEVRKILWYLVLVVFIAFCSSENESTDKENTNQGGIIKGKVILENESDIADVRIDVKLKDTNYATIADTSGNFTLTSIPPGKYTLKVMPITEVYKEVEIENVEVEKRKTTNLGNIYVFTKKGSIKGIVVQKSYPDDIKKPAGKVNFYVIRTQELTMWATPPIATNTIDDRCQNLVYNRIVYSGTTNEDGTFEVKGLKAGSNYVIKTMDKTLGMGYSNETRIEEDGDIIDVGEVIMVDPNAFVQIKDEEDKYVIRVTNKDKVLLNVSLIGLIEEVKITEGGEIDKVEWMTIVGSGSYVINLS